MLLTALRASYQLPVHDVEGRMKALDPSIELVEVWSDPRDLSHFFGQVYS